MKMILKIFAVALFIQSCTIFDKDETLLSEHKLANGDKVNVYFVGLGATTNDVIQVRKSGSDTPIWISEKYNFLKASELVGDTAVRLVLGDTGYYDYPRKFDTITVNIK